MFRADATRGGGGTQRLSSKSCEGGQKDRDGGGGEMEREGKSNRNQATPGLSRSNQGLEYMASLLN